MWLVAGILTFGTLFGFFILWLLGFAAPDLGKFISLFRHQEFVSFFKHLSIFGHSENFISGLLDTRDLVYCIDFTFFSLLLCRFSLGARKWRS